VSTVGASLTGEAQSQLRRVTVMDTSLSTSRIGLGTHALHRLFSSRARQNLLAAAYGRGLRYFDTAPSYGAGIAELELGRFAAARRARLVLATKFGITRVTGRSGSRRKRTTACDHCAAGGQILECPAGGARLPAGQLAQTIQKLREVEPGCVLVLSTNAASGLQEVVDSL
jgi:hypothetical protein